MSIDKKIPESTTSIRFPDCDPFNHLNNAKYLDYFINERENHLLEYYDFNLYEHAQKTGISWVVTQSQIAYFLPARLMEKVVIQSTILEWNPDDNLVEMRMWNEEKTILKALLWTRFTHFDLLKQKRIKHGDFIHNLFSPFENPIHNGIGFEERVSTIKKRQSPAKIKS